MSKRVHDCEDIALCEQLIKEDHQKSQDNGGSCLPIRLGMVRHEFTGNAKNLQSQFSGR